MTNRRLRLAAIPVTAALLLAACGDDDDSGEAAETTAAAAETTAVAETAAPGGTEAPDGTEAAGTTEAPAAEGWTVDTEACPDDSVNEPIEGTVKIGAAMPLSGGNAVAFAPVSEGYELYIDHANAQKILPDHTLEVYIEDDQYKAELTTPAVEKMLDQTQVNLFSGIIGSANNLAVRDLLNEECVPQLNALTGSGAWGDVASYPWTTGGLVPYAVETKVYLQAMQDRFPDGATAAVFYVNSEFGQEYNAVFQELAPDADIEIVDEQTIEAVDTNPPTSQVTSIASNRPDIIMAVPLGSGCATFLNEVANAKAANPGWEPVIYQTNTCSSELIMGLAGPAGNGVITALNVVNVNDPKFADNPGVKAFSDAYNAAGLTADKYYAAVGWALGESTVETLRLAAESEDGLTRAAIINAARNVKDYAPSLYREGITVTMDGENDAYAAESLQVLQWDAATKLYTEIGEPVTEFEGTTVYEG